MDKKYTAAHAIFTTFTKSFFVGVFMLGYCTYPSIAADNADSLQSQLDAINTKIKSFSGLINQTQQQRIALATEIKSLEENAVILEKKINDTKQQVQSLNGEIGGIENKMSEKERIINAQKDLLKELMRSYYENTGREKLQLVLPTSESLQILNQNNWMGDTSKKMKDLIDTIQSSKASLIVQHDSLQGKKQEVDSLQAQLEQRSGYLESSMQSKESLVIRKQEEEKKYNTIIDDLEEKRNAIEDEINQLEATKTEQLDVSKLPAFNKSTLFFPVANPHQTQSYGKATWTKQYSFHNGVDFADKIGTPILAAANGTVLAVGNNGKYAYGKWIAIDHGNGLVTMYGHLSVQKASKGESVKRGEVIGLMGSTGFSTGPHVHFTVFAKNSFSLVPSAKVNGLILPTGAHVNPVNYLP